jgi:hypothetical protein
MPGRKRKPASKRDGEGNAGHRPIPAELDFSAAGDIGKPRWLDKDAKREYKLIVTALVDLDTGAPLNLHIAGVHSTRIQSDRV